MKTDQLWIFGYGSLVWNPGFEYVEQQIATLKGFHRSFCMRSIHHRGTVKNPGLVLALDAMATGECAGMAFRVAEQERDQTLAYLRERELISSAYLETEQLISLADGGVVRAVTFIIDPDHGQYCAGLSLEEQAQIIAVSSGDLGPNSEYLHSTAQHLQDLGIGDKDLNWLSARVKALTMA